MKRRVLQLLPAPVDPDDGIPVYRVASYSCGTLTVSQVVAWALVRYGSEDDADSYETAEPVYHSTEYGSMRVGNTEHATLRGLPPDVVLSPHQDATGVSWEPMSDSDSTPIGTIDVDEPRKGAWSEHALGVECRPPTKEAKP